MKGCVGVIRPLQRKAGKTAVEKDMRDSCKGREKRSGNKALRLKSFLAKTFRGFTTTASGSKFSDDSWDKIQDLTKS